MIRVCVQPELGKFRYTEYPIPTSVGDDRSACSRSCIQNTELDQDPEDLLVWMSSAGVV